MRIVDCQQPDLWNRYVAAHPCGGPFHLFGWKEVFQQVYGLSAFYFMAVDDPPGPVHLSDQPHSVVRGICALFLLCSPGNRRRLIALPYLDVGGILVDNAESETRLLQHAVEIARANRARWIELRQAAPLKGLPASIPADTDGIWHLQVSSHKASLRRDLPADSGQLMRSFKSKLRSQIRKAMKNGLSHTVGGAELLPAFYAVFSRNMRDLGSPVHARRLFETVLHTFSRQARIVLVRQDRKAVAAALVLRFQDRLHNPWASSLRSHRRLGANMLLYWAMLAHACDTGLTTFDFGRSSPGAGTFRFKRQWGAEPSPLYWYYLTLEGKPVDPLAERLSFSAWKRLPVGISRLLGPPVRRHIGL
ncbi:FemAB family XrtA/PEP-CTERM system-associated protein [Desulfosarcina ovata]|uniref:BioF2-like acetyltransferase domain-containing protein n=1 Tax=Desulfosarcina ovata subsp. ovata TaxID=2752305 RepID=A0A5K8ADN2_9BACT|nr:FemAB family XrtA/PEP-CTERM system-associated protein [Desulfosarcina ovata]BBO90104.1 hypothetical protein DSCOOX_32840 [Desulfosarcina ovata subsp. ovata]